MQDLQRLLVLNVVGLLVLDPISIVTAPVDAGDDDLETMLTRVDGIEFGGLKIATMRGDQVDLIAAAAWLVLTDCNEEFSNLILTDRSKFNIVYESNFEAPCFQILPVFYRRQQQLDLLAEQPGRLKEKTLQRMGATCSELIKDEVKDAVYEGLMAHKCKAKLENKAEFRQLRLMRQRQHESLRPTFDEAPRCLSLAERFDQLRMEFDSESEGERSETSYADDYEEDDYDDDDDDDFITLELSKSHPYEKWTDKAKYD